MPISAMNPAGVLRTGMVMGRYPRYLLAGVGFTAGRPGKGGEETPDGAGVNPVDTVCFSARRLASCASFSALATRSDGNVTFPGMALY
jgi:hypothetical protein